MRSGRDNGGEGDSVTVDGRSDDVIGGWTGVTRM